MSSEDIPPQPERCRKFTYFALINNIAVVIFNMFYNITFINISDIYLIYNILTLNINDYIHLIATTNSKSVIK